MGFYFKVAPGVRVRVTGRGVRTSIGPRAARLHFGAGGTGISTGAGPFTYYHPVSRSAERSRPGAGRGNAGSSRTQAGSPAALTKAAEASRLAARFEEIQALNQVDVPPQEKPLALPPALVDERSMRASRRAQARRETPVWQFQQRRAALRQADALAAEDVRSAADAAVEGMYRRQAALDQWWAALLGGDADVVLGALAAAFEDNAARAAAVGFHEGQASIVVVVPPVSEVPERRPALTPAGNLSLKKLTKTETAQVYKALVAGHVLLTVREAFAVVPSLTHVRIVAVRMAGTSATGERNPEPLLAASFSRASLQDVRWTEAEPTQVLHERAEDLLVAEKGTARTMQPIDLRGEPQIAAALQAIAVEPAESPAG